MHTVDSHHSMSSLNAVYYFHSDSLSQPVHFGDDAERRANGSHTMLRRAVNVPNMNGPTATVTNSVSSDGNYVGEDEDGGADGDSNDCCDFANRRLLATAPAAVDGGGVEVAVAVNMYRL